MKIVLSDTASNIQPDTITFGFSKDKDPILVLKGNGDIFVKGNLIENDKEVVDALRDFVKQIRK